MFSISLPSVLLSMMASAFKNRIRQPKFEFLQKSSVLSVKLFDRNKFNEKENQSQYHNKIVAQLLHAEIKHPDLM